MKLPSSVPRDGDQLRLDLFKGVPWDGRNPRGLTRVQILLSSRREPPGHVVYPDSEQLEIWPESVKATRRERPRQAAGAPSLLPLKAGARRDLARRVFREEFGNG